MGCDGGTIPRRDELVRVKKKPEQKDKEAELAFRWRHCTIKQLPLQPPIVACSLGKLYSKEAVIEGLLDRSTLPDSALHIKNLKDVKPLTLTPNPAYDANKAETGDGYADGGKSPFICPVIGLEMNGKYKFCALWTCGCVMSERALKEVKSSVCHRCQKPFEPSDVVILNAEGDDLKRMEDNAAARKLSKKSKKKRETSTETSNAEDSSSRAKKPKIKKEEKAGPSRPRVEPQDPAFKKAKEDYSVAKDPTASEVLKSIFTTHKTASEQTRAHWVTYNPFYN
ncbi:replication termination factor 2 [Diachasmimorpha longicaudata]|uniref:replication termination factor 2 n=1 Tax=Diachasmimorpha longicaudata TaxID=58733 RepID=UPI0030B89E92